MLATFGLQRLEAGLENGAVSTSDVAEFLEQAEPNDVRVLAREGMPEALDGVHRRISEDSDYLPSSGEWATDQLRSAALVPAAVQPDAARRPHDHSRTNRQFAPRQHANRV